MSSPVSNVLSFAEESCWDGETFRSIRIPVVFVVAGHAIQTGKAVRHEFVADYGLWYDYDDEVLLHILKEGRPDIDWGWFVYHKRMDHATISMINPDTGKVVGSIYVRGRAKQKLSGEILPANVVSIQHGHVVRQRRAEREQRRSEREDPQ